MTNPNLRISLRSATPRISRCTDLYDEAGKDSISVDTVKRARRALKDELNIVVEDRRDAGLGYWWVWPDKKTKDAAADIEVMVEAL